MVGGEGEAEDPQARPVPPTTGAPATVTLTAYLSEGSAPMTSGIVWRIFAGHPARDGSYHLLQSLQEPQPTVELNPGEYLINIAYGRANLTRKVGVWPEKPVKEDFVVNAGGLRINATLARAPIQAEHLLKFEIFSDAQDQFGNRQKLLGDMRPGVVIRLNSGIYHIVSTYGDANSMVATDVVVEPGKITEAGIDHDAGKVTLKLVQRSGGEAAADTRWTVYNAVGEVIKESAGAFPTHVLAAGDYRVAAQHGDQQYAGAFTIGAGETKLVEVLMQ
jgi:preprotein translocase subunit YajC